MAELDEGDREIRLKIDGVTRENKTGLKRASDEHDYGSLESNTWSNQTAHNAPDVSSEQYLRLGIAVYDALNFGLTDDVGVVFACIGVL